MGGIANGIAYHGGFIPYVATFLHLQRLHARLGAPRGAHRACTWSTSGPTTPSALGEDGPTHQPVEHYAALRAMPNLTFVRPGDPNEAVAAWRLAVEQHHGPIGAGAHAPEAAGAARDRERMPPTGVARGGYVLAEAIDADGHAGGAGRHPHRHRLGAVTGHGGARRAASSEGIRTRVVSLPCWERFAAAAQGVPRRGPAAERDPVA